MSDFPTDPLHSDLYSVSVDGSPVQVHGAKSCRAPWPFQIMDQDEHPDVKLASPEAEKGPAQVGTPGNAPYAFASFPVDDPTTVKVVSSQPLETVKVQSQAGATEYSVHGNALTLHIDRPTKLSIELDGRHGGLLLFADPPQQKIPNLDDPGVLSYGPGRHRVGVVRLTDNQTLYLAPGAILEGGICAENAKNVRICGRGIVCGDPWNWRDGPQPHMLMFDGVDNLHIEGITIRCSWQWTCRMMACCNVSIRNVKICGGKNLNDDGINPCSTQDVLIQNCFIRTQDDNISVKAHCDDRRPCQNIEIRNCLHWSDLSRVLMVGPESHADHIGHIHMHDCEVLHLGPPIQKTGFGDWDGCAPAFCLEAGEDCRMEQITVEEVKLHVEADRDGKDVILVQPLVNQFMKRRSMGNIRDVFFRNVAFVGESCAPTIRVMGKDQDHTVERVHFNNVTLFGHPLTRDYHNLTIGDHTNDITIR